MCSICPLKPGVVPCLLLCNTRLRYLLFVLGENEPLHLDPNEHLNKTTVCGADCPMEILSHAASRGWK